MKLYEDIGYIRSVLSEIVSKCVCRTSRHEAHVFVVVVVEKRVYVLSKSVHSYRLKDRALHSVY